MAQRRPDRVAVPPVQRLRIRYAKRGPLRFSSHRDFQRALERALRRARVPMAYSAGFSPHPRISYANAAPTGAASEAEYVEIAVVQRCDPHALATALDESLPNGLDIVEVVEARTPDLAGRLSASEWLVELPGSDPAELARAWREFMAAEEVAVSRMTKSGLRTFDARSAALHGRVHGLSAGPRPGSTADSAGITMTLRHGTPLVRPDDVLVALAQVGGLRLSHPARLTRLTQGEPDGTFAEDGRPLLRDPLAADRAAERAGDEHRNRPDDEGRPAQASSARP